MPLSDAALKIAARIIAGEKLHWLGLSPAISAKRLDEFVRYGMYLTDKDGAAVPQDPKTFEWQWRTQTREAKSARRICNAIIAHGGRVMPYAKLSKPAQLAMAFYMSIDGEAWPAPKVLQNFPGPARTPEFQAAFRRQRCHYVRRHGHETFGYVELPRKKAIDLVWYCRDEEESHGSFAEYHKWYQGFNEYEHSAKDPWPSIIDTSGVSFLQDGWHRFHRYVAMELEKLPFLYYPY